MIYSPSLSRAELKKKFKPLRKLKYNQFRWWRMYDDPRKPLHSRQPLRDRILNGDFDFPHYYWQALWCQHDINDMYEKYKDDGGRFIEQSTLTRTRYKRLMEDFEREEHNRLKDLRSSFLSEFRITKEQLEEELESFGGTLIDLYFHLDDKYKIVYKPMPKRRGRPRKNGN